MGNTIQTEPVYSDFAYDDAFRTLESECDDVVLSFINFFFHENYDSTARIRRLRNEHFIEHKDHSEDKRITDSYLEVIFENIIRKYHIECESKPYDDTILVRLFEYDSQIALDDSELSPARLCIRFPNSGILVLRKGKRMPACALLEIQTPGGTVSYEIPILYESSFSINMIFAKKLYFLIPFYIFNLESRFEDIESSPDRLEEFAELLKNIMHRLDQEVASGNLSVFSHSVIISLTHKVAYKLTFSRKHLNKKVGDIMGGKVMDLEVIKAHNEGITQGISQGISQGLSQGIKTGVDNSIQKLATHYRKNDPSLSESEALKMAESILK